MEGLTYHARDLKPRKPWVTYGCWILSAALIIGGILTPYRVARCVGGVLVHTDAFDEKGYSHYREGLEAPTSDEDHAL